MPPNDDLKTLYDDKCLQFDQLSEQFNELQEQSTLIMNDLQDEIKDLKRKNQLLQREVKDLKQKKKYFASTIQRQLDHAQKQKNQFKNKFKDFEKKVIQLEIINEDLQNQVHFLLVKLRATKSTLEDYQASAEKTMEELAILRVQLQESTSSNQQQIARLMQQLKQTEDEITVMHKKGKASETYLPIQQNQKDNDSQQGSKMQKFVGTPTSIKRGEFTVENQNQQGNKKDSFKQTMRNMRNYMQTIDKKMQERRKTLLNHQKQVLMSINSS